MFFYILAVTAVLPAVEMSETFRGDMRYSVQLLTGMLPSSRLPRGSSSVVMIKKGGKRYRCHLPDTNKTTERSAGTPTGLPRVASYLQPLMGTCFYRLEGWWTYEFCFQKSIRQFHQEKVRPTAAKAETTTITQEYTLGAWTSSPQMQATGSVARGAGVATPGGETATNDPGSESKAALLEDVATATTVASQAFYGDGNSGRGVGRDGGDGSSDADELKEDVKTRKKYWSQLYGNGTQCLLTSKRRETEVRLQCSPNEPSFLSSVEEVSTCKYLVHFSTNLLCKHPAFVADENKEEAQTIHCELLGPGDRPLQTLPASSEWPTVTGSASGDADDAIGFATLPTGVGGAADSRASGSGAAGETTNGRTSGLVVAYFDVGDCMVHSRHSYRGVIIGRDMLCRQSETWIRANGIDQLKLGRQQPFYHVLPDARDRQGLPVNYVAHELILPDTPPESLKHELLSTFFHEFDAIRGRFVPTPELRMKFPHVEAEDDTANAIAGANVVAEAANKLNKKETAEGTKAAREDI